MKEPQIKILAAGNVFSRMMFFQKSGDTTYSHQHEYDHGTLLSYGSVLYEVLDENKNVVKSKEFNAPTFIFVPKLTYHRLVALEDNTVCACIHALRTIDNELLDPDFLIDNKNFEYGEMPSFIHKETGKLMRPAIVKKHHE